MRALNPLIHLNAPLALALSATITSACAGGEVELDDVSIPFAATFGDTPFSCDGSFAVGTSGAEVRPIDMRFYVHNVAVLSGGEEVPLALDDNAFQGTINGAQIALLDFEDNTSTCDTGSPDTHTEVTGKVPAGTVVEGVSFSIGVPDEANHLDAATGPAPLNVPGLWWTWSGGYKYMKIDMVAPENPEFFFHMGATTCSGDPTSGFSCAFGNVANVRLDGATSVAFDAGKLYTGVDVNEPLAEGDAVPGCMAFAGDPECPAMFEPLGLDFESAAANGENQVLFKAGT